MSHVIPSLTYPEVPVTTGGTFPVRRIYGIAANYLAEPRPPEGDPSEGFPVTFTKPADAIHFGGDFPYPIGTSNVHYEAELVVALKSGGVNLTEDQLDACIYGYAAGCDLTRRDQLDASRANKGPWDLAKAFDDAAIIGPITPADKVWETGSIVGKINGEVRQDADLNYMKWSIKGILMKLSTVVELKAGDLIYSGSPKGIAEIKMGETMDIIIDGVEPLSFTMVER